MFVVYKTRLALQAVFFIVLTPLPVRSQAGDELATESHHAKELMAAGQFAEAIPIYKRLVKSLPGNDGLVLNLALAEEMSGRPAEAVPHFQAVLKNQPENLPALLSLSMALVQLGRSREAIAPLQKVTALDPANSNAIGMLAEAEASQKQFEQAALHFRELTSRQESDPRVWYGLGKSYESLANGAFERLNKVAPGSPWVAELLADSRVQTHQYRSAFFFYREAQRKLPDLPCIHSGLADVYRSTGHLDWAAAEQKLVQSKPATNCKAHNAACSFLSGDYLDAATVPGSQSASPASLFWATKAYNRLAADAFNRLTQLPESVEIHAFKAQLARDHRQNLEAAEEWRAALKLNPDDDKLKRQLAAALFDAKDYQSALALIKEQLAKDPQSPELNYLMGGSLFRTEKPDKALPYLEAAVRAQPEHLAANATLGLTLVALNKDADAIPYLRKALTLDDDGSLHYSLARAYRAAGHTAQATEAMQQYQKIQKQNQEINDQLSREAEITAPHSE